MTDHTADNAVDTISEDEIIKKLNEKFPNYMENRLSMFRVISHIMRGTSENAKKILQNTRIVKLIEDNIMCMIQRVTYMRVLKQ